MATAVIPDEGMKLLQDKLNGFIAVTFQLRLYQNNYTPIKSSVFADFTIATFSGYASQTVTFGGGTVTSNISSAVAGALTFTRSIGATNNTIYGWFMVDSVNSKVYAANLLSTPKNMNTSGDAITITLTELLGDLP